MHQLEKQSVEQLDAEPPSNFLPVIHQTLISEYPQLEMQMQFKNIGKEVKAEIYKDRFCIRIGAKKYYLVFSLEVCFKFSLNLKSIQFFNRETKQKDQFITQSWDDFKLIINNLRRKCPQNCFNEKFQILRQIGKSKSSEVYACKRIQDNQIFAVKKQKNGLRLKRQIEILNQLNHPNIIHFHQYFIENQNDDNYLVLEYEDGGTLLQRILSDQKIEYKQKIKILTDMLNALQILRVKGIVHRDIKPENILYSKKDGNYKLSDFGLAVRVGQKVTKISGTPGYIAPQFLVNQNFQLQTSIKSDIYSMGLTFYQLFTNKRYFEGQNQNEILLNNSKALSIKSKAYQTQDKFKVEKKLLKFMIRKNPKERLNSCQIIQSHPFKKLNRYFKKETKLTISSEDGSQQVQQKQDNFIDVFRKMLRVKSN